MKSYRLYVVLDLYLILLYVCVLMHFPN